MASEQTTIPPMQDAMENFLIGSGMGWERTAVPLKPGEEKPSNLTDPSPDGYRMETDSEFRARIKADIERKSRGR